MQTSNKLDLAQFLHAQSEWSDETFGYGDRRESVVAHIAKELTEVLNAPSRVEAMREFCDVILLALDGARRCAETPDDVCAYLISKQKINMLREWGSPDSSGVVEHVRDAD